MNAKVLIFVLVAATLSVLSAKEVNYSKIGKPKGYVDLSRSDPNMPEQYRLENVHTYSIVCKNIWRNVFSIRFIIIMLFCCNILE